MIDIHYTSSSVMQGAAEVLAYGTAVKIVGDEENKELFANECIIPAFVEILETCEKAQGGKIHESKSRRGMHFLWDLRSGVSGGIPV